MPEGLRSGWRGNVAGGLSAALLALPVELVYGLFAVAPLGAAWAEHGLRAALWACVLAGALGLLLRSAGGMLNGSASATALLLGTLATALMRNPEIQASADPAMTSFGLLLSCTLLAGVFQWVFGMVGIGRALKYVPYPVIAGLMCGVAMLLMVSALRPALGLHGDAPWQDAWHAWLPSSTLVFACTLALCLWTRRRFPRLPGPALALLAGTLLHHGLAGWAGDAALGATSSPVTQLLPQLGAWNAPLMPGTIAWLYWLPTLAPYALVIAAIASLDSLLCLPTIEETTNRRFDGDRQLRNQGVVNLVAGLLGGTVTSGSLTRVTLNLAAGGHGVGSGLVYAATLAVAVLFLGDWLALVPMAATSAILVFLALGLVDDGTRRLALQVLQRRRVLAHEQYRLVLANFSVIILVAAVAVLGNMMQAVGVGVLAAMFLFVRAGMRPVVRRMVTARHRRSLTVRTPGDMEILEREGWRIVVVEVEGALFFGTSDHLARDIDTMAAEAQALILDFKRVTDVDPTGARSLLLVAKRLRQRDRSLAIAGASPRISRILLAMGLESAVPPTHWYRSLDAALESHEDRLLRSSGTRAEHHAQSLPDTTLAQGMSAQECRLLLTYLRHRVFAAGDRVFRHGEPGNSLFVTTDCVVDILVPLHNDEPMRVASLAPGVVFGEMALLDNHPRSADAMVKNTGSVWELTRERLTAIEQAHPHIARRIQVNLSLGLAARLRQSTLELREATED
ncbi:MAG: SulP family inorganic anion transporter [Burkholderiaceae bacterium]|nr:SLC26A/SulP transporter family protein [Rhodoferax sp.]MCB2007341.1 SLC26A/SulP transporter family protein [Rhodoferax sp.]MCB2031486.1 SLC26A/SulP transporter family protein [Rhodoferax sp.]